MADANSDVAVAHVLVAALDAAPTPVIVSDYRTIIFANAAMRVLLRVRERSEIEGRSALDFVHSDSHQAAIERGRLLRSGSLGFRDLPVKLLTTDGHAVAGTLAITPFVHEGFRCAVLVYEPLRPSGRPEVLP